MISSKFLGERVEGIVSIPLAMRKRVEGNYEATKESINGKPLRHS